MLFRGRFYQTSKQIEFLAAGSFVEYDQWNDAFYIPYNSRAINPNSPFEFELDGRIYISKVRANTKVGRRRTVFKSDVRKTPLGYIVDLRKIYEKDPEKHKDKLDIIELLIYRYRRLERQEDVCFFSLPRIDAPEQIELSRNLLFLAKGTVLVRENHEYSRTYVIKKDMGNHLGFRELEKLKIEKAFLDINWDSIKGAPERVDMFHDVDNNKLSQSMLVKKLKYLSKGMPYVESIISVLECRYEESPRTYLDIVEPPLIMKRIQPFLGYQYEKKSR
tara:strand:+ start:388 stop:1215 length:828 start_codon:yes stop_codon:yes gene_type:complete